MNATKHWRTTFFIRYARKFFIHPNGEVGTFPSRALQDARDQYHHNTVTLDIAIL
jgi:hypothetical protein